VLFDLAARKFYIFWPGVLAAGFHLSHGSPDSSALALFLFTAVAGGCVWLCLPANRVHRALHVGGRVAGRRPPCTQETPINRLECCQAEKARLKHAVWLRWPCGPASTFVGYFSPIQTLAADALMPPLAVGNVLDLLLRLCHLGQCGFMREQVCKYMCPYARFQSVMFDSDTLTVPTTVPIGEPRGRVAKRSTTRQRASALCRLQMSACRSAHSMISATLQYECIGCQPASTAATRSWTRWATARTDSLTHRKRGEQGNTPTAAS